MELNCVEWIEKTIVAPIQAKWHSISAQKDRSWLLPVAILTMVILIGSPVHLSCACADAHGPVNCTKETRLLWFIPLPEEMVVDVRGAHLASIPGDEYCDPCYRVELETGGGIVPVKSAYTNGSSGMQLVVEKVNTFAHSAAPGTLQINEPGLLSLDTLLNIVFWFILVNVAGFTWGKIKSAFGRVIDRS
jgi:hypothetical protein